MIGTVLALGGGGFSVSDDGTSAIDDYLLELTGKERPRVCLIPTASGDDDALIRHFEESFAERAETSVLTLFCKQPWGYSDPAMLLDQDVIYVTGGSTANLLAVWRLHSLPEILRDAAAKGVILAGISAGMNCWFEGCSTDSYGPLAPLPDGLGFLDASACPHYLGEPGRRELYQGWVADGTLAGGYAADDYTAVLFRDGELVEAVAEREGHPVFRVERTGEGESREVELPVRLLG